MASDPIYLSPRTRPSDFHEQETLGSFVSRERIAGDAPRQSKRVRSLASSMSKRERERQKSLAIVLIEGASRSAHYLVS